MFETLVKTAVYVCELALFDSVSVAVYSVDLVVY